MTSSNLLSIVNLATCLPFLAPNVLFLHDYIISPESGQLSNHDDGRKCAVGVYYTLVAFVKVFFHGFYYGKSP